MVSWVPGMLSWARELLFGSSLIQSVVAADGVSRFSSVSSPSRTAERRRFVVGDFLVPFSHENNDRIAMTVPLFAVVGLGEAPTGPPSWVAVRRFWQSVSRKIEKNGWGTAGAAARGLTLGQCGSCEDGDRAVSQADGPILIGGAPVQRRCLEDER